MVVVWVVVRSVEWEVYYIVFFSSSVAESPLSLLLLKLTEVSIALDCSAG